MAALWVRGADPLWLLMRRLLGARAYELDSRFWVAWSRRQREKLDDAHLDALVEKIRTAHRPDPEDELKEKDRE